MMSYRGRTGSYKLRVQNLIRVPKYIFNFTKVIVELPLDYDELIAGEFNANELITSSVINR